jgi:hypothetical protein
MSESVYDEPRTIELLRSESRLSAEERKQERWWSETLEWLESVRWEEAADRVEEASTGWDNWRGFPLPGFESPRYLSERERQYKAWFRGSSPEAERARHIRMQSEGA